MRLLILLAFLLSGNAFGAVVGHNHCDGKPPGHNHDPGPGNGNGHSHDPDECGPVIIDSGGSALWNLSTRGFVMDGPSVLIGGFIIVGDVPLCVVIRGRGISPEGFPAIELPDPKVRLFRQVPKELLVTSDNWMDDLDQATKITEVGLDGPLQPQDAGLFQCLEPGGYTAILTSADGEPGVGIVEVFDAEIEP